MKEKRREELIWYCLGTIAPTTWWEGGNWWCSPEKGIKLAQNFGRLEELHHFSCLLRISLLKEPIIILIFTFFWEHHLPKDQERSKKTTISDSIGNKKGNINIKVDLIIGANDCVGMLDISYIHEATKWLFF